MLKEIPGGNKVNNNDLKKAYLQSYIPSINAAKRIEEEIEQLRLDKMMPSVIMDDMPHAHNKTDLSDYMAKLDELINKLIAARYKRIDLYAEIFADIEKMDEIYHALHDQSNGKE